MFAKRDMDKAQVRNKAAAPMQITAEQILREALDRQGEETGPSKVTIASEAELEAYRMGKRKEFEDQLRRQRNHVGIWIKYAVWEEQQQEFRRARSIFERALQVDYQNVSLWLKYIEMEISHKFIQHARTLYDRATSLLPRVDQFWYKYAYMEERLENYAGARSIYEKWMGWKPTDDAWLQYAKFEERCGEITRARTVYERYISELPSEVAFVRYCKFEERQREFEKARAGYETCVQLVGGASEDVFLKYVKFESRRRDGTVDLRKSRMLRVFKLGMEKLAPENSKNLYAAYVGFTQESGSRDEIEQLLFEKRRVVYEKQLVDDDSQGEDSWDVYFNYSRMEVQAGELDRAREIFERSIAHVPNFFSPKPKRYMYLWLFYAQFEEVFGHDVDRAGRVLETAVSLFEGHKIFFSKIYFALAQLRLRTGDLLKFREVMEQALEATGGTKLSLARAWVETEIKLGNTFEARRVAAKLIELCPVQSRNWLFFVDLEIALGEVARASALCEMALRQQTTVLDSPELIYKKLIEIESELTGSNSDPERVRDLFKQMLEYSEHYKIFLAYADFEADIAGATDRACAILEGALEIVPDAQETGRAIIQNRLDELVEKAGETGLVEEDI